MKYVTIMQNGTEKIGILSVDCKNVILSDNIVLSKKYIDINDLIMNIKEQDYEKIQLAEKENKYITPLSELTLISPIPRPRHDILCVGLNYHDHILEAQNVQGVVNAPLKDTVYFGKRCLFTNGPEQNINGHLELDPSLDYETELAVIIGKKCLNISVAHVEEHIFGYSIFNDYSARTLQKNHLQYFRGKGLDGFSALGPWIVGKEDLPLPLELNIQTKINGDLRQNSNTTFLIKNVQEIISELSHGMTLEAGDIISTGTPGGVGAGFSPPKFLKSGDVVESSIEKIGILRNIIG